MVDVFHSSFLQEQPMSRFAVALLSMTFLASMTCVIVSEARAAPVVCDASICISKRCKNAKANQAQVCSSGCQIDAAENKKKGLCK
jgi:hypothetical protein